MYYIIGADGQQYGPVTEETLRAWINEGRANGETRARKEGETEWKRLGDIPPFTSLFASAPPPTAGPAIVPVPPYAEAIRAQVQGPAIGLMVTALLSIGLSLTGLLMNLIGASRFAFHRGMHSEIWGGMMSGSLGQLTNFVSLGISALVLFGAYKMQRLENHAFAVLASILALLPCTSPCCVIGLPIGIWALVVLYRPGVREAFR